MKIVRKRGFSLLEVVFAFAILELALLAIIGAFPAISRLNRNAWNVSVATQLAQAKMEEITTGQFPLQPRSAVGNLTDSQLTTMTSTYAQQDNPQELPECTRIWWGEDLEYYTLKEGKAPKPTIGYVLQSVKIKVYWRQNNQQRSITLVTNSYFSRPLYNDGE